MSNCSERQPHAVLDLPSRAWKAAKIERLLGLAGRPGIIDMLEVGTGSGGIANYFGTHASGRFRVEAVDVVDNRLVSEGYRYTPVTNTKLPFADASFDVVITNHVIEHVGDALQQRAHLAELRRVLRTGGIGYLAVPNRWMLVEPHYRLAFLSWLPRALRSQYLRLSGRGEFYDCEPLQLGEARQLLRESGFDSRQMCVEALRATLEIERPQAALTRLIRRIPSVFLEPFAPIIPTLIFRFWHRREH